MHIACRPALLIANKPTTALDVTTQAQVLLLLRALRAEAGLAMLFITHNLALVPTVAERVLVMYASQVVETGAAQARCWTRRSIPTPRRCWTACRPATCRATAPPRARLPTIAELM